MELGVLANSPEQWTLTANKAYINVAFHRFFLVVQENKAEEEVQLHIFLPCNIPQIQNLMCVKD